MVVVALPNPERFDRVHWSCWPALLDTECRTALCALEVARQADPNRSDPPHCVAVNSPALRAYRRRLLGEFV